MRSFVLDRRREGGATCGRTFDEAVLSRIEGADRAARGGDEVGADEGRHGNDNRGQDDRPMEDEALPEADAARATDGASGGG